MENAVSSSRSLPYEASAALVRTLIDCDNFEDIATVKVLWTLRWRRVRRGSWGRLLLPLTLLPRHLGDLTHHGDVVRCCKRSRWWPPLLSWCPGTLPGLSQLAYLCSAGHWWWLGASYVVLLIDENSINLFCLLRGAKILPLLWCAELYLLNGEQNNNDIDNCSIQTSISFVWDFVQPHVTFSFIYNMIGNAWENMFSTVFSLNCFDVEVFWLFIFCFKHFSRI